MTRTAVLTLLLSLAGVAVGSDAVPAPEQSRPVALVGGTVHPVSGPPIEGGTVVFEKGRITAVGKNVPVPPGAERVDLAGKRVYPGLFESLTDLGLVEIDAVRATVDTTETGAVNPNAKAWVSVNPDSEVIPVTRSNGVLLAVAAPSGDLVAGQAGVLQLDGWTYEDLTLKAPVGLVIRWPDVAPKKREKKKDDEEKKAPPSDRPLKPLDDLFEQARAYHKARKADPSAASDLRYEALGPVLAGELPVIAVADDLGRIQSAVAFADRFGLKLIVYGGYDAPLCAALLKERDVPVVVGGVYRLPLRRSDAYDRPYSVPEELRKAGVRFCIAGAGRQGGSNARNLPYHAATAAAFGLPADEAVKAITLYPARILGVADRVGSIEVGKDATLFVADGDPLEAPTQIVAAYVRGRAVDLTDRHKQLYRKYQSKYDRMNGAAGRPGPNGRSDR